MTAEELERATRPQEHPSGVTLTPTAWVVVVDGGLIGDVRGDGTRYHGWHGALAGHSTDVPGRHFESLPDALASVLACHRNPEWCAELRQIQADTPQPLKISGRD